MWIASVLLRGLQEGHIGVFKFNPYTILSTESVSDDFLKVD